jgi:Fe-S cluster assembly protein SufD
MNLKDKLTTAFFELENKGTLNIEDSIHLIRAQAIENFEKKDFPTKKDEEWKYTSLKGILKKDYIITDLPEEAVELKEVKKYFIQDVDTYKVVFINGVYSSFLSETTHSGIDVCLLSSVIKKPKYKLILDHYFNKIAKNNESLTDLNTAFTQQGAFIHIPKNTIVAKPIQIIFFTTGGDQFSQPRNLIVVDENSHVQILERHQTIDDSSNFTNSVTEIFAGKKAIVDYNKIQNDTEKSSLVDQTFVQQKDNSIVSVNTFSFGGALTRNNLEFYQEGERLESNLNGFTLIGNKQHVDNHTTVFHNKPNCESYELYRGIYTDNATGVFNGKVIVNQKAQLTNAFQQNNSILIGDKSNIYAKPQLEIFADDVKCSHGCTIGQLDRSALFYMQQRGIPKMEAHALLLYAFGNDVIEKIKFPKLKERITKLMAKKLGVELGL